MTAGDVERGTRAFIGLGSNVGERRAHLEAALRALDGLAATRLCRCSPWIETEPVGGPPGQGRFLNGVAELRTELAAPALLAAMQAIEAARGRTRAREARNGPRTLDLDLLLFGELELRTAALELPHPRLEERRFVLAPLAELEPELVLPRAQVTVRERLRQLEHGLESAR